MKRVLVTLSLGLIFCSVLIMNSCKKDKELATLTTAAASNITINSITSGGSITSDGGAGVTVRGVCYSTSATPLVSGTHTTDDQGTGSFVSSITGLTPNTLYHIRAYATNSVGTAYGEEVTATTTPILAPTLTTTGVTSITLTTAVSGGNITSDGNDPVTARGVCWSTTANPTITNSKTTNGTGSGTFVSNLTALIPGTVYHIRAYATNSVGTGYGADITFTASSITIATLSTVQVTSITLTTAVSGGTITSDGNGTITARGVCWSTTTGPTITGSKTTDGTGTGTFASTLTPLNPGTIYYVRAYATNSAGTGYGSELSFTTSSAVFATLTTTAASAFTQTTATSGGNISSNGGANVTARGVCWSTSATPTIANSITTNGTGNGVFTSSITGLTSGTLYHLRAYATNSAGTAYGNEVTFTTSTVLMPTLTTAAVTTVTLTTAVSGGTITSDGGGNITAKGISVSTSPNPTVLGASSGTGTATYISNISGLTNSTTYYVRAYATNSAGTAYGNQIVFTTSVSDNDGNTYATVTIGTQIWMAENLKTTKLTTNVAIPEVTNNAAWAALSTPAYSVYENTPSNKTAYGLIYNWFAVGTTNLCPTGWHVPTDGEYKVLETTLGMAAGQLDLYGFRGTDQGTKMKSTSGWQVANGTNASGFNAVPAGYRYGVDGVYKASTQLTYWWSSTQDGDPTKAWYRRLDGWDGVTAAENAMVFRSAVLKAAGKYVRCLKGL